VDDAVGAPVVQVVVQDHTASDGGESRDDGKSDAHEPPGVGVRAPVLFRFHVDVDFDRPVVETRDFLADQLELVGVVVRRFRLGLEVRDEPRGSADEACGLGRAIVALEQTAVDGRCPELEGMEFGYDREVAFELVHLPGELGEVVRAAGLDHDGHVGVATTLTAASASASGAAAFTRPVDVLVAPAPSFRPAPVAIQTFADLLGIGAHLVRIDAPEIHPGVGRDVAVETRPGVRVEQDLPAAVRGRRGANLHFAALTVEGRGHLRLGDRRDAERERREHPVLHFLFLRLGCVCF